MKSTAKAPANIAFIKYWGKKDEVLRIPINDSISMNLSDAFTTTTIEFSKKYHKDEFIFMSDVILGSEATPESDSGQARMTKRDNKEEQRVIEHLDRIRKIANSKLFAKVVSQNSFPRATGIASSASGFAALTLAASSALGLKLSDKELSILARLGSGSACRSIPDGFVYWKTGKESNDSYGRSRIQHEQMLHSSRATKERNLNNMDMLFRSDSYAYSLYNEKYWDLVDIIVVVSEDNKKTTSTKGHENAASSIFFEIRMKNLPQKTLKLIDALKNKDIEAFGNLVECEAIELHTIMMTQNPPLFYWNSATLEIINRVRQWRNNGLSVYFTIDAGPNVHLICEAKEEKMVLEKIKELDFVKYVIVNSPSVGARLINKHLF